MSVIYLNGDIIPAQDAKISVFDRSYLFGEGLFESFRSYDGKIPFLDDHLGRLEWSSTFLGLEFPQADYKKVCDTLLDKNNLKDARFKMILSRTSESLTEMTQPSLKVKQPDFKTNITILCEAFDESKISKSYKLKVIKDHVNESLPLVAMKTTNYLVKILAHYEALDSGFDDGILLNAKGNVTETSSANIFWVDKDGKLFAIMDEQGCLSGTMKKRLLAIIRVNKLHIKEGVISPSELSNSKEVFITNSVIGIKPVVTIDKRQISGGETGSVTAMLMDLWAKNLKDLIE